MIAEHSRTIPKRGDRVGIAQQEGVFEVADINSLMQTANVNRLTDKATSLGMYLGLR
jgi:hypothetical protein